MAKKMKMSPSPRSPRRLTKKGAGYGWASNTSVMWKTLDYSENESNIMSSAFSKTMLLVPRTGLEPRTVGDISRKPPHFSIERLQVTQENL